MFRFWVLGSSNLELELEPGTWNLERGTWNLELGAKLLDQLLGELRPLPAFLVLEVHEDLLTP